MGALFIGVAVAISSLGIGRAEHFTPNTKVYNCSTGTACLTGNSSGSKTFGIYAEGTSYDALHAVTSTTSGNSAISGISTGSSGNGNGVYGRSSNGDGVHGTSSRANGVFGETTIAGTSGAYASGVYGKSTASVGVTGEAAGYNAYAAILALSDGSAADIFDAYNSANGASCYISPHASLTCSGKITGGGPMLTRQRSDTDRHVLTYAAQAATPTIEDLGVSQMHDGIATVEFPADFASVIDRPSPYYVFLTPMGDTRGLYVSMENAASFQVRENMHGRSNVTFQYRIIGVPLGAKNVRLPTAPEMKVRLPKLLPSMQ